MKISILVPFRDDSAGTRGKAWSWLERRWRHSLPDAELIVGSSDDVPFSKSAAINQAADQATGDILVVVDADIWIAPTNLKVALKAAAEGDWALPQPAWRLTEDHTNKILAADPTGRWPHTRSEHGTEVRNFGALMIMPAAAFTAAGGMDPAFRGWGGEDSAFCRALDTMWKPHIEIPGPVYHLWHQDLRNSAGHRIWEGQQEHNDLRAAAYRRAQGNPEAVTKVRGGDLNIAAPVRRPHPARVRVRLVADLGRRRKAGDVLTTTWQQADAWIRSGTAKLEEST